MSDDRTKAEALRIAYEDLKRFGYKYGANDIGFYARKIMEALNGK